MRQARADGRPIAGDPPSKTIALHLRIYAAARRFDANTSCVNHTHGTHCVTLTLGGATAEVLPPITPYFVMKVGHVPMIAYQRPGAAATAEAVSRVIGHGDEGTPVRAVMLERLGPTSGTTRRPRRLPCLRSSRRRRASRVWRARRRGRSAMPRSRNCARRSARAGDSQARVRCDPPPFRCFEFTIRDLAADVRALLDELGITDRRMLGMSMGGCVAMTVAASDPPRVRKLILCDTTARYGEDAHAK
jgi:pimeloyl-ACP methyl ester carboxylesterase